ncbi:CU044_5270 family protein [Actinoplanes sp. NPDC024001]|uniref:CU044_5270 family protein n=1 Tax=Actinoplanes sp. NPDC024001 TaxID=3154598 RepID=UPI0033FCB778
MDEITLTRELGRETPLASPERLAPARALLLAEMAPVKTRRRGRSRWTIAGATVAAGLAAVAAITVPGDPAPSPTGPPPVAASTPVLIPVGTFLDEAAVVAGQDDDVVPRADQYVYLETRTPEFVYRSWLSVSGERDGVVITPEGKEDRPGCKNGKQASVDSAGRNITVECEPEPRYLPDMPTEPDALAAWLKKRNVSVDGTVNVSAVGKEIGELAGGYWLRPAQRAALYRVAAKIEGIKLAPNTRTDDGRVGTGLAWAHPGEGEAKVMLIFDPKTYQLLDDRLPVIVDRIGQRP